jgi:hypothetical protein
MSSVEWDASRASSLTSSTEEVQDLSSLQQRTTATTKISPMELPAKTSDGAGAAAALLRSIELQAGRVFMVIALGLLVNELTTGQSLPQQVLTAVTSVLGN